MTNRLHALQHRHESGQALIMFAVMATAIFGIMSLAVEGGRAFVTYRQMQSAADMAALVGAQKLPNAPLTAYSDACLFAQKNGFGDGTCSAGFPAASGTSAVQVCIPPTSLSPYSNYPYGSVSTCGPTAATTNHFIEVQIQDNLGNIPVFNTPITLYAHAIAKVGIDGLEDYAIANLDPTTSSSSVLKMQVGTRIVVVGSSISNNLSSASISTGTGQYKACNGQWLTAANETTVPTGLVTYAHGTNSFAPPDCADSSGGSADTPTQFVPNSGQIGDPYGDTTVPVDPSSSPTVDNVSTNCPACAQPGNYYSWASGAAKNTGTWNSSGAGTPGTVNGANYEFFPGTYTNLKIVVASGKSAMVYFNPGVYTLPGSASFSVQGTTNMCVYGAPACDIFSSTAGTIPYNGTSANCSTAVFTPTSDPNYVPASTWYYYCSPWGKWDSALANSAGAPSGLSTVPTFLNLSTGTATTTPLNGVTFFESGSGNSIDIEGSGSEALAAPNPCPGTGNSGALSVDYPAGSASGSYVYADGTSSTSQVYPNADFSINGECSLPYAVWKGELGHTNATATTGQHLHILFFAQNSNPTGVSPSTGNGIKLAGSANQNWYGVIHSYPTYSGYPGPPSTANACSKCSVTITGSSGGGGGPPVLSGQVIGDGITFTGSSLVNVFDRPGNKVTGPGTQLVQ